jgi:hypothetical protein
MKLIAAEITEEELDELIEKFEEEDEKYSDDWYNRATDEEIDELSPFNELCEGYQEQFDAIEGETAGYDGTETYKLIAGEFSGVIIHRVHWDERDTEIKVWAVDDWEDIENLLNELDPEE